MRALVFRVAVRMATARSRARPLLRPAAVAALLLQTALFLQSASWPAFAQQDPLRPGEAVVTRFSGTATAPAPGGG
jgi:hypothetical protein